MIKGLDIQYIRRFLVFAKPYKGWATIGILMLPLSIVTNLLFPWLTIRVIDDYLSTGNYDGLPWVIGAMIAVVAVNYIADSCYSYFLRKTGQHTLFDIRMSLFQRILNLPRTYFDRTPTGVTLSRLTSDLEAISDSFVMGVLSMVRDLINTVALIILMLFINWPLTLVVLTVFPPVLYITHWIRNKLREIYKITRSSLAKGTGYLQECLFGVKTVQLYRAEEEVEARYQAYTQEFLHAQMRSNKYDAVLFSVITGVTTITIGLIIWYGSGRVVQEAVTLGVLIAFINNMEKVFVPLRDFTGQIAAIQRSFAAFDHLDELFQEPLEEDGRTLLSPADFGDRLRTFESLEFRDVSFRYTQDSPYVLKNVSFKLEKGHQLALVGTTGSGKSTILRLISKVYQDYEGQILLNGIELSALSIDDSMHLFSLMQQDVYLFDQSIAFNIGLGKASISRTDIQEAARYVYADEFIKNLPDGYDMALSGNGGNLSAGQTQLISFARAVAQGGQVIMLDEATSSVDSVTENLIQRAISRLFKERTVIAIAHRLSTIRHSDTILVLDQGQVVEQGTHEQLLARNGVYAGLLNQAADQDGGDMVLT
ncbi:ABC transporter ATP-binding protein [Reinekea blandensis]|uniref:ABC transporter-related protein n=1 Tax=Reinekea blandensis MED297 TaxID=314283 RepID=A4BGU4_9GAMM|nr:ABC transporter ATP-binding protein [Reinekea blandensis]EAR08590.1 ABC transporter-related protein [Reinekea sp. MED297] [Reinekea blandensis MED297]